MSTLEKNLQYEQEIDRLKKELDRVNSLYKKAVDDLGKANTTRHNLQVQLNEKIDHKDTLIHHHARKDREINKLKERLKIAYGRNKDLVIADFDKGTEIQQLKAQLTEKDSIIHALNVQLDEKDKETIKSLRVNAYQNRFKEYQEEIDKREATIRKLRDQLSGQQPVGLTHAPVNPTQFELRLRDDMHEIYDMLMTKNKSYGNSALDPVRIFSSASPVEQILVRIDDKLSRIKRGAEFQGEDTIRDLIGYFFLFLQAKRNIRPVEKEYSPPTVKDGKLIYK